MSSNFHDISEMDAILAFLPIFSTPGFKAVKEWRGGASSNGEADTWPWPTYSPSVTAFFEALSGEFWHCSQFDQEVAHSMIHDPARVNSANLDEIRTMLAFCSRGEKFCDGHWESMIEEGYVQQLLARLHDLRLTMASR